MFLMTYTYIEAKSNYHRGSILILRFVPFRNPLISLIHNFSYVVLIAGFYYAPPSAVDIDQGHFNTAPSALQEFPPLTFFQTIRWYLQQWWRWNLSVSLSQPPTFLLTRLLTVHTILRHYSPFNLLERHKLLYLMLQLFIKWRNVQWRLRSRSNTLIASSFDIFTFSNTEPPSSTRSTISAPKVKYCSRKSPSRNPQEVTSTSPLPSLVFGALNLRILLSLSCAYSKGHT